MRAWAFITAVRWAGDRNAVVFSSIDFQSKSVDEYFPDRYCFEDSTKVLNRFSAWTGDNGKPLAVLAATESAETCLTNTPRSYSFQVAYPGSPRSFFCAARNSS